MNPHCLSHWSPPRRVGCRKDIVCPLVALLIFLSTGAGQVRAGSLAVDKEYLRDRAVLDELQRDAFKYIWEHGCPDSGMAYEANYDWETLPVAVGGTGFGIAAIVVAADREWISRDQAVARLMKIALFLRDKTPREKLHGAFPHWLNGSSGKVIRFGNRDGGADIVETSLLMQGLLLARAYFNGPGVEERLREIVTELWEGVEWDWFTNGEENGLYWHWDPDYGFHHGLKILGYNECLITYVLAAASPTHPISRKAYDYWTAGVDYLPRDIYGYRVEASSNGGGPLFLAQYSFIGLDPRRIADDYVEHGYFVRGVMQTMSNRGYCLYEAPAENRYGENFWGLSAGHTKKGYAVNDPLNDNATVSPTAAVASLPYTPQYSMQVVLALAGGLRKRIWGECGPYDGISLRDEWVSSNYLAIDQLPMVGMIENYRSGLLWDLFMADADVRRGLERAGMRPPELKEGFPEAVVALRREGGEMVADAYDVRRHPDTGLYAIPYWLEAPGDAAFRLLDAEGAEMFAWERKAPAGRNALAFEQCVPIDGEVLTLVMTTANGVHSLPIRFY